MSLEDFLPLCLQYLQQELPRPVFEMYAGQISVRERDGAWVFCAPTAYALKRIREDFLPKILEIGAQSAPEMSILLEEGQGSLPLRRAADGSAAVSGSLKDGQPAGQTQTETVQIPAGIIPDYTFDTLVPGKGNQLAYHIGKALVDTDASGSRDYNPLFIYGGSGLGKTHLVQAIGNGVYRRDPQKKIRYMHSNDFLHDYVQAARSRKWDDFKKSYDALDLLIIDDVQFIAGKGGTMEEFFQLFNRMLTGNKQVVLTSDQIPNKIEEMDERLVTRFSSGLTAQVEPPEFEMRVAILQKKAELMDFRLPEDCAFLMAQEIKSSVRILEGALKKLSAYCRFSGIAVPTLEAVKIALKDILAVERKEITVEQIQKTVADYYQIRTRDMLGNQRKQNIVRPRQMAMLLCTELTPQSLPAIAEAFNRKDHTTVMHARDKMRELLAEEDELRQNYEVLKNILNH